MEKKKKGRSFRNRRRGRNKRDNDHAELPVAREDGEGYVIVTAAIGKRGRLLPHPYFFKERNEGARRNYLY